MSYSRGFHALMRRVGFAALGLGILLTPAVLWPNQAFAAPPIATGDTVTVAEDAAPTLVDVLANDATSDTLTIISATDPAHGTVVVAVNGLSLTYAPDANYNGSDAFQYTVQDGSAGQATASVTVTVSPVNDAPVAGEDPSAACLGPDTSFGGAFPIPEDWIGYFAAPWQGWFVLTDDCDLLANDTDVDGDQLTWEFVTDPAHGDAMFVSEGFFAYNPDQDYSTLAGTLPGGQWVSDSFTYRAYDGTAYSNVATMKFWIAPINDAPTFTPGPAMVFADEDSGAYSGAWATNVSGGPGIESAQTVSFDIRPPYFSTPGLFSVPPAIDSNGNLTFTAAPDKFGSASMILQAKDNGGLVDFGSGPWPRPDDTGEEATLHIIIRAVEDPPTAVDDFVYGIEDGWEGFNLLSNDFDVDGTSVNLVSVSDPAHGTVTTNRFDPDPDWNGIDTFTYTISDPAGNLDTGTVTVSFLAVNDAPIAIDDSVSVTEDSGQTLIGYLANDTDIDNVLSNVTSVSDPPHGTATAAGYTPDPDWSGTDAFTYTVNDGSGGQDTATVTVTVVAVNDNPVADDDSLTVTEDQAAPTPVAVLAGDMDIEGDLLLVTGASDGAKGIVTIDADGLGVRYMPLANANGSDTFSYTIGDGHGGTDTATVQVTIVATDDPPDAVDDGDPTPLPVAQGMGPTPLTIIGNDTPSPDAGEPFSIIAVTQPANGVVAITGGGSGLTYDPTGLYSGPDQFAYTISDSRGLTDTATVHVNVTLDVTPPVASAPRVVISGRRGERTVRATIAWTATELQSGISLYRLQQQTDGGAWTTVTLPTPTTTRIVRTLAWGHTYRFRVRATDGVGNVGGYAMGRTISV